MASGEEAWPHSEVLLHSESLCWPEMALCHSVLGRESGVDASFYLTPFSFLPSDLQCFFCHPRPSALPPGLSRRQGALPGMREVLEGSVHGRPPEEAQRGAQQLLQYL